MALTARQAERVRYLVEDEWGSDERIGEEAQMARFSRVLAEVETAEELHEFADKMNWDGGGAGRLMRVLAHPLCDRGTALLIYWRANPIFYLKYGTRERVQAELWPAALEDWDMLRHMESRLATPGSFATAKIPFDPANDHGRDLTKQRRNRMPRFIFGYGDGKYTKIGEEPQPDDPEIDVRRSLPAVVFEPQR
jgi:uncharacterized protein DUF4274